MSSLEQEQEILHLCLTGFYLRKPVKTVTTRSKVKQNFTTTISLSSELLTQQ